MLIYTEYGNEPTVHTKLCTLITRKRKVLHLLNQNSSVFFSTTLNCKSFNCQSNERHFNIDYFYEYEKRKIIFEW